MSTHVVVGASGQIGSRLLEALGAAGLRAVGTYNSHPVAGLVQLDARDREAVARLLEESHAEVVYVPASDPNVDKCEREPEATAAVNVGIAAAVADAARANGARPVFFSTDYVFDGERGDYTEDDEPSPQSEYARQKLRGEELTIDVPGGVVVRTAVVYSWERQAKNFVVRLRSSLLEGQGWRVPVDQIGNPTYAPNLAAAVVELAQTGADGVFHVAGRIALPRYDFALAVARAFGLDESLIARANTDELGQLAPRPLNASLRVDKAQALLTTPLLAYDEGLRAMAAARENAAA